MNIIPLDQYIKEQKLLLPSLDEKELRRRYRNYYQREYRKHHKKSQHIITLRVEKKVYQSLTKEKKQLKYSSMNAFIIDCVQAYLTQEYVFPQDENIKAIHKSLQTLANTLVQQRTKVDRVIRDMNPKNKPSSSSTTSPLVSFLTALELQHNLINTLKEDIAKHLFNPLPYDMTISWEEIKTNEENKLDKLITFLTAHKQTLADASD